MAEPRAGAGAGRRRAGGQVMGGYGRRGAVVAVKATPEVTGIWRQLVGQAQAAAEAAPSSAQQGLSALARDCRRAVVPGLLNDENPCIRLSKAVRLYLAETTAGRRGLQDDLRARADAAAEFLDGEEAALDRRARKDIEG